MEFINVIRTDVKTHMSKRWSEWGHAILTLVVGTQLLINSSVAYPPYGFNYVLSRLTEHQFALLLLSISFFRLAALTLNGSVAEFRRYSPLVRLICAIIDGTIWFWITIGIYEFNPHGWAFPVVGFVVGGNVRISLAIREEVGKALAVSDNGRRH